MDKKQIQYNFVKFLETNYSYARPKIMASNVFYAYNNDIGMNFWDIFESNESLLQAKSLIEKKFIDVGRKDPRNHAGVHYGCFAKFKEFLDAEYGGVQQVAKDFTS